MAEISTYHTQKAEDFRTIVTDHLDGEIAFYEQVMHREVDLGPERLITRASGPPSSPRRSFCLRCTTIRRAEQFSSATVFVREGFRESEDGG